MLATNVRHPRDFPGDLQAQIGSVRPRERGLLRLLGEYGVNTMSAVRISPAYLTGRGLRRCFC